MEGGNGEATRGGGIMQKVIIIGCPGGGKSTFARELHKRTGLPLHHLDMMYWNADRTQVPREVFQQRLEEVLRQECWIIDGNYNRTMEMRMEACDTIFFLDYPVEVCLEGARARKGTKRSDLPWTEGEDEAVEEEFLQFIRSFQEDGRPQILERLEKYKDKQIFVFKSREEANRFLEGFPMIKAVEEKDLEECVELIRSSFGTVAKQFGFTEENAPRFTAFATDRGRLAWHMLGEKRPMYAYFEGEKIVGYYSLFLQGNQECELSNLCVSPDCRHRGIGEALLNHAFEKARELGCKKVNVGIVEENVVLRKWYEAQGCVHLGTKKFEHFPFTCGFMTKEL